MYFLAKKDTRVNRYDSITGKNVINTTFTISHKYLELCDSTNGVIKFAIINKLGLNAEIDLARESAVIYSPQGKRYVAGLEPMAIALEKMTRRPDAFLKQTYHFHIALPRHMLPIYGQQGRCTFSPYVHETIFKLNPQTYIKGKIAQDFSTLAPLPAPIKTSDGLEYWSIENYYQASKTKNYNIKKYLSGTFPAAAHGYWRNREKLMRPDWYRYRRDVMFAALKHRFKVDTRARKKLLDTGGYPIVQFNNWADRYWGVNVSDFTGRNMMGRMLMNIRHKLIYEDIPF